MLRPSRLLTTVTAVLLFLGVAAAPAQAQTFNRDVVSTILPSGMGASWVRHSADVTRASYSLNTDTGKLTGLIRVTRLDPRAYTAGYFVLYGDITGLPTNSLDRTIEVEL